MCRVIERRGWRLIRINGSHHIYAHPDFPSVILSVPVHGNHDLSPGTQHDLLRRAGLTDDDL